MRALSCCVYIKSQAKSNHSSKRILGIPLRLVGKPSAELFQTAARELGLAPERIAMVGDDLDADIRGAKSAGLVAVAVQTGKYRPEAAEDTRQAADAVLGSIADLPRWLGLAP